MIGQLTRIGAVLRRIVGQDDGGPDESEQVTPSTIDPDDLKTPLKPAAVERAQSSVGDLLGPDDHSLVSLLNKLQRYVEDQEYVDRHGNAFFERLLEQANDPDSLITIVDVRDQAVFFICPAEVWAQLTHDLRFTDSEALAVADAHQLYADHVGLAAYAPNVRIMCVAVGDERLQDLLEETGMVSGTDPSAPSESREQGVRCSDETLYS